jgi:hypothetical protein
MKHMMGLLTLLVVLIFASPAHSVPIIDITGGTGGQLAINGSQATGVGISLNLMTVTGAPANNLPYSISAVLNFDTLANEFVVTGDIPSLEISGARLLWGTFSKYFNIDFTPLGGAITASGVDQKNADLLAVLGLPADQQWEFFGFGIAFNLNPGKPYRVVYSHIINTAIEGTPSVSVPEPTSLFLLGTGLLALAGISRKRAT